MNVIVTDLDGTLLNDEGLVSQNTKEYLIKRKALGDKIVISSGRGLFSCKSAVKDFSKYVDYFILQNGSVVYNDQEEVIFEHKLSKESVSRLYELTKDIEGLDLVYFETDHVNCLINREVSQEIMRDKKLPKIMVSLASLKEDVYKCLFLAKNEVLLKVKEVISKEEVTSCFSCPTFLEINALNVSKGNAVKELVNSLDNVNKTFIFGDNDNDISMLSLDYQTVAMKNATASAMKAAKFKTKYTNDEDGLIKYLMENLEA